MDEDRAILSAAFAFRDRTGTPTDTTARLRALLPATLDDVPESDRRSLSDRVLRAIASDAEAVGWFARSIDAFKSYTGAKSPIGAVMYACPRGDSPWPRTSVLDTIPLCPTHHLRLVLL